MTRVGVFGGSFNPPHVAHVMVAAYVLSVCEVDQLLVVPCFRHPFARILAPFGARFRMCEMAFGWLAGATVSNVEQTLGGESLTLRTLQRLADDHSDWAMRLIMGSDLLAEAPNWWRFDEVAKLAPPIVLSRTGAAAAGDGPAVFPEVASTSIRAQIARGEFARVRELVPRSVLEYVRSQGLYQGSPDSP